MCEYCGCQTIPAIADLTREHEQIRDLAREAIVGADEAATVGAVRRLLTVLRPHTRVEEEGLFPAMRREFAGHVRALTGEHREVQDLLGAFLADPGERRPLQQAVGLLFEHILREQDGLFPASLAMLSAADWDRVDAVRAATVPVPAH